MPPTSPSPCAGFFLSLENFHNNNIHSLTHTGTHEWGENDCEPDKGERMHLNVNGLCVREVALKTDVEMKFEDVMMMMPLKRGRVPEHTHMACSSSFPFGFCLC